MKNCLGCNRLENPKFICPANCKDAVIYENEVTKIISSIKQTLQQIRIAP
jgi:hypothetical protein